MKKKLSQYVIVGTVAVVAAGILLFYGNFEQDQTPRQFQTIIGESIWAVSDEPYFAAIPPPQFFNKTLTAWDSINFGTDDWPGYYIVAVYSKSNPVFIVNNLPCHQETIATYSHKAGISEQTKNTMTENISAEVTATIEITITEKESLAVEELSAKQKASMQVKVATSQTKSLEKTSASFEEWQETFIYPIKNTWDHNMAYSIYQVKETIQYIPIPYMSLSQLENRKSQVDPKVQEYQTQIQTERNKCPGGTNDKDCGYEYDDIIEPKIRELVGLQRPWLDKQTELDEMINNPAGPPTKQQLENENKQPPKFFDGLIPGAKDFTVGGNIVELKQNFAKQQCNAPK